jgi:hypothetical protein
MGTKRIVAILFLAATAPLARSLLFGAGLLDDDVFLQSLPAWDWLSRSLHSGQSPLWSPELMGGFPIAFTQYPFLYPPALLLALLLPPTQAYAWLISIHLLLAGGLTFLFCRTVGLGRGPSLIAALSFQLSSEVVAGSSGFASTSAWVLPGMFLAAEMVLRRGGRYGPLLSLVVAAALLGGHPQLVLAGLAAGAVYALVGLVSVARSTGAGGAAGRAAWLALAAAVGVAGAAVRLVPTLSVVELSTRATGLPDTATSAGNILSQGLVVGYLLPLTRLQTLPWGAPDYAGPVVVVLVLVGGRRLISDRAGRVLALLGLLSAILSMGDVTPLYLLTRLPLFSFFREPSRLTIVTSFALCVMAAISLDGLKLLDRGVVGRLRVASVLVWSAIALLFCVGALFQYGSGPLVEQLRSWSQSHYLDLLNPLRPRMALALFGIGAALATLTVASAGKLSPKGVQWALLVTTVAVMVPMASILNPTIDPKVVRQTPETAVLLNGFGSDYRVFSHRPGARMYNHASYYGPGPEAGFTDDLRYRFQAGMLAPVLNLRWGIPSADGYEQLHSTYQEAVLRYLDSERVSDWYHVPGRWMTLKMADRLKVMRMQGVRYLLSGVDLGAETPTLRTIARVEIPSGPASLAAPTVYVLEDQAALPLYYLVSGSRIAESDEEVLDAVAQGRVDPARTVMIASDRVTISADGARSAGTAPLLTTDGLAAGTVDQLSREHRSVTLRVTAARPAFLVTSDSYWPGWRVFVDGQEVPVYRANVAGRAVFLPAAGTHQVEFRFEPPGFVAGLAVSIFALLGFLVWLALSVLARSKARLS